MKRLHGNRRQYISHVANELIALIFRGLFMVAFFVFGLFVIIGHAFRGEKHSLDQDQPN